MHAQGRVNKNIERFTVIYLRGVEGGYEGRMGGG